jgi:hypothetical protein
MSNPTVTSSGGHVGVRLTLMVRFRRHPNSPAHVETFWRYGRRMGVALCGKTFTDERTIAAYPLGSDKAKDFWLIVCRACKDAMDGLS